MSLSERFQQFHCCCKIELNVRVRFLVPKLQNKRFLPINKFDFEEQILMLKPHGMVIVVHLICVNDEALIFLICNFSVDSAVLGPTRVN